MTELSLIQNRYREVEQEIAQAEDRLSALKKEREELDMAGRVIARLSGAKWPPPGATDAKPSQETPGAKPESIPTMPEMISEALDAFDLVDGAKPKDIRDWIAKNYWPQVKGEQVSSVLWRMWKRGQVVKDGSRYKLPEKKETADENPTEEPSAASLFQPSPQGREGGPGGGT